jgi:hypothetical protein
MNVGFFVILLGGAVLLQQALQISANHCEYNEEQTPCKPCTENCCDDKVKKCPKPCFYSPITRKWHTCQCKKNFYRTKNGKCVAKNACPRLCPAGEVPTKCDFPCQPTCANPNRPPCPTFACGDGDCICPEGQIRKVEGGKCVPCDECCPKNEVFKKCGTCEPSCQHPEPRPCPKICIPNVCQCKPEYVRNGPKGPCIRKNQCPYVPK